MTTTSEPPREGFRLNQLIYDTRYRSLTIQVVALILLVLGIAWLVTNTVQNLQDLGKDFDFGFLGQPAGYDINQTLIPYTNQMTHARAAMVGIINTLLVSFMGCVLATILGVLVGVLRLSKNVLVSGLMAIYVEGFRNVPLLLWIIAIFALMTESMPPPSSFRGDDPEASMVLGDSVAITNRGVYIPNVVFTRSIGPAPVVEDEGDGGSGAVSGGGMDFGSSRINTGSNAGSEASEEEDDTTSTGGMSFGSSRISTGGGSSGDSGGVSTGQGTDSSVGTEEGSDSGSAAATAEGEGEPAAAARVSVWDWVLVLGVLALGIVAMVLVRRWASAKQKKSGVRPTTWWMQVGLVVLPVAVTFWALGARFTYPELQGFNFGGGVHLRNSFIALWLALSLYTSAFIAELVRGGILSVSKGQSEAAFALGLRPSRTMNLVILPQALRVIIPPLISQYLNLTKNSSLAIAVGYMDVRSTLGGITINQTGRELEGMLLLGLFYLVLSLLISSVLNVYNNAVKLKER